MKHMGHEHISDYVEAVDYIAAGGYVIKGIVVDGLQQLFIALKGYKMQMCQFHMVAIVRRKLTKNPQLKAGRELLDLIYRIKAMEEEDFLASFAQWKLRWHDFLKEKTIIFTGFKEAQRIIKENVKQNLTSGKANIEINKIIDGAADDNYTAEEIENLIMNK